MGDHQPDNPLGLINWRSLPGGLIQRQADKFCRPEVVQDFDFVGILHDCRMTFRGPPKFLNYEYKIEEGLLAILPVPRLLGAFLVEKVGHA